jgi:integrase
LTAIKKMGQQVGQLFLFNHFWKKLPYFYLYYLQKQRVQDMLKDIQIKQLPPPEDGKKGYKIHDQGGLFLEVPQKGSKRWRFRYKFQGKSQQISLGIYPKVSLKKAREEHRAMLDLLHEGKNPSTFRKLQKYFVGETVEEIGREWHKKYRHTWTDKHADTIIYRLESNIFPYIGNRPAKDIEPPELLACLRKIETRGHLELARRVKQICGQLFRYAVSTGKASRDITADLRGAIPPSKTKNFPTITDPKQIGELLRKIDQYPGMFITRQALKLAPLAFVRPGELRHAEWLEIDLEARVWKIPAEKMKMKQLHVVPLSQQACKIFEETKPLTGRGDYVFPSHGSNGKPMSENTINQALRRIGYPKDIICGHGFRAMASTLLNEQGWLADAIEKQLAHAEKNKSRAAYNYAQYLPERTKMMQYWADYLDSLKAHTF